MNRTHIHKTGPCKGKQDEETKRFFLFFIIIISFPLKGTRGIYAKMSLAKGRVMSVCNVKVFTGREMKLFMSQQEDTL